MSSIDRRALMHMRGVYFLMYAALAAMQPYLSLFLDDRGVSPQLMGWMFAVVPLCAVITPPLLGVLADKSGQRSRILGWALLASAFAILWFLPPWGLSWLLLAMLGFSLSNRTHGPLADAITHDVLQNEQRRYGRIRVWGSVGFALMVLASGLLDSANAEAFRVELTALLYFLAALLAFTMPTAKQVARASATPVVSEAWRIMTRPAPLLFLLAAAIHFGMQISHDSYFSLHVRRLGHGDQVTGAAWATGVGVEIAIMMMAPVLFRRLRPSRWLIICGFAAALRWGLLSLATSIPALIAIQGLHGFTFGLWYLASVGWVQRRAPSHLRASLQAVLSMAMGAGAVLALVASGTLVEMYGVVGFYRMAAPLAVLGAGCYAALVWRENFDASALQLVEQRPGKHSS